jgi:hypothetical protein
MFVPCSVTSCCCSHAPSVGRCGNVHNNTTQQRPLPHARAFRSTRLTPRKRHNGRLSLSRHTGIVSRGNSLQMRQVDLSASRQAPLAGSCGSGCHSICRSRTPLSRSSCIQQTGTAIASTVADRHGVPAENRTPDLVTALTGLTFCISLTYTDCQGYLKRVRRYEKNGKCTYHSL